MRLLTLVIAVLIISLLLYKQLGNKPKDESPPEDSTSVRAPKIPHNPKDIRSFEGEINDFVKDAADERAKLLEEQEGN